MRYGEMRLVKEELADGRVGVGTIGVEQEEDDDDDDDEEEHEEVEEEGEVVVEVLPRMSSM